MDSIQTASSVEGNQGCLEEWTGPWAGRPGNLTSIPGWSTDTLSSVQCPDHIWDAEPSLSPEHRV